MPRRSKKESKAVKAQRFEADDQINSSQEMVANVNNGNHPSRSNMNIGAESGQIVQVSFKEGNQVTEMSVSAEENGEFPGPGYGTESDASDVEFENDHLSENSEAQTGQMQCNNESSADRARSRPRGLQSKMGSVATQIMEINDEISQKLSELHAMMQMEGMEQLVQIVEKCAAILKRKQGHSNDEGELVNVNTNATSANKEGGSNVRCSVSAKTIYESAVPKCNSFSSEEDLSFNDNEIQFKGLHYCRRKEVSSLT